MSFEELQSTQIIFYLLSVQYHAKTIGYFLDTILWCPFALVDVDRSLGVWAAVVKAFTGKANASIHHQFCIHVLHLNSFTFMCWLTVV